MQKAESWRLFVAIPLPEGVKDEVEKAQMELRRALPNKGVRWTKRGQFHLTLKFLGDVAAERVDALIAALGAACRQFSALRLRAERIGFFPHPRFPKVVWAWVHDELEFLPKLQQAIESGLREFNREEAEGTFTGHITLGRCHGIHRPEAEILGALANEMTGRFFGDWTADTVELIRSELLAGGSRYTTLASVQLRA